MKTEWDYSELAVAYEKRPGYSDAAIDAMLAVSGSREGDEFCDVGAGVAHLSIMLAERHMEVLALEPNDVMRTRGIERSKNFKNIRWQEGVGEATGQLPNIFDMVTFGSSFNVCDRQKALKETSRILKPGGWFACMWNHRHLEDPHQSAIEGIIKQRIPGYGYGSRREDQKAEINKSGAFGPVVHLEADVEHEMSISDCLEAWESHATLQRQAGDSFPEIINSIDIYLKSLTTNSIRVPYSTNIWLAQLL
jgi:ubiquinone/menaquinone biosynthesis C-methylase UbiE